MYQPKIRKLRSGIPILRNCEIDAHAEAFLRDYDDTLLTTPKPVDIESFAEFYLGLSLDYVYLSHCGLILGRMVFQEVEPVPVYLPNEKCADYLYAKRGTLLIDNTLLDDRKEYRLRSTIGHECGHWVFHSEYYAGMNKRNHQKNIQLPELTGCKKTDIEGNAGVSGRRRLTTDADWLEHHAKYFSAAILMPKTPFLQAVSELIGKGLLPEAELSEKLAVVFHVSPASVKIRLEQLSVHQMLDNSRRTQDERQYEPLSKCPVIGRVLYLTQICQSRD